MMRAIVIREYGGVDVLEVRDVPSPRLASRQVLVEVRATALNRADLLQRRGLYPSPTESGGPEIPGLEFSGVVAEVGDEAADTSAGDRVCGLIPTGGYAEKVAVDERMLIPIPDNLTFDQAAAIPEVFLTAYDALKYRGQIEVGDTVLIHAGGSGVGTAATQIAKLFSTTVFTTVGSDEKARASEELGADRAINYNEEDFAAVIDVETESNGADVVLDVVGGPYLSQNLQACAQLGTIVSVGLLGGASGDIPLQLLLRKRASMVGTVLRSRPIEEKMRLTQRFVRQLLPQFGTGRLRPVIDCTFELGEVREAHEYMENNKNFGKIILKVGNK